LFLVDSPEQRRLGIKDSVALAMPGYVDGRMIGITEAFGARLTTTACGSVAACA
jgi:predicted oxidoreductase